MRWVAPLHVGKAGEELIEDLHLADLLRMPALEGGLGPGLERGVDCADLFQVHGGGFGRGGKKGLRSWSLGSARRDASLEKSG